MGRRHGWCPHVSRGLCKYFVTGWYTHWQYVIQGCRWVLVDSTHIWRRWCRRQYWMKWRRMSTATRTHLHHPYQTDPIYIFVWLWISDLGRGFPISGGNRRTCSYRWLSNSYLQFNIMLFIYAPLCELYLIIGCRFNLLNGLIQLSFLPRFMDWIVITNSFRGVGWLFFIFNTTKSRISYMFSFPYNTIYWS